MTLLAMMQFSRKLVPAYMLHRLQITVMINRNRCIIYTILSLKVKHKSHVLANLLQDREASSPRQCKNIFVWPFPKHDCGIIAFTLVLVCRAQDQRIGTAAIGHVAAAYKAAE